MLACWPTGLAQIKREFGDPIPFLRDAATRVTDCWPDAILGRVELPAPLHLEWDQSRVVKAICCHRLVAASLGSILTQIHDDGLWYELEPYGGCYCWRVQRGSSRLSAHCWAIAVDFRVSTCRLGQVGDMPMAVVEVFEASGWTWGGRWARRDDQHFQAASGY